MLLLDTQFLSYISIYIFKQFVFTTSTFAIKDKWCLKIMSLLNIHGQMFSESHRVKIGRTDIKFKLSIYKYNIIYKLN